MDAHEKSAYHLPRVGMRNIKTALAAALCALIYYFFDRSPAFACIGAIFGMGSDLGVSKLHGGNRFFGTLVGGFIGMGLFALYVQLFPDGSNRWFLIPMTFVGVVILIVACQYIWVGGVQPGGVVLCIILFNTPTETYISYALNRILDTGVGVLMALFVNGMLPGGFTFGFMHRFYMRVGIRDDVAYVERKREPAGEEANP
nr:aromatic acid exporter family protein [uncultured Oscillibacter sp.]